MLTVGESTSAATAIAKELLNLADLKILHGQDPSVARERSPNCWSSGRRRAPDGRLGHPAQGPGPVVRGQADLQGADRPAPQAAAFTYTNQAIDGARQFAGRNDRNELTMKAIAGPRTLTRRPAHRPARGGAVHHHARQLAGCAAGSCTSPASAASLPQPGSPRQASSQPADRDPHQCWRSTRRRRPGTGCRGRCSRVSGWRRPTTAATTLRPAPALGGHHAVHAGHLAFYGVDGNGDGRPVITDDADSVHSAANYLVASGALDGAGRRPEGAVRLQPRALVRQRRPLLRRCQRVATSPRTRACHRRHRHHRHALDRHRPGHGRRQGRPPLDRHPLQLGPHAQRTLNRDLLLTRRTRRTRRHRVRLLRARSLYAYAQIGVRLPHLAHDITYNSGGRVIPRDFVQMRAG